MRRHDTATPWAQPAPSRDLPPSGELESQVPTRAASFQSDVLVPFCQAGVTGVLLGIVGAVALFWPDLDAHPVVVWLGLAELITCATWLLLLLDHRRLLWAWERPVNLDLNQDGQIDKPEERLVIVNAEASHRQAEQRTNEQRRSKFAFFVARLKVKGTSQRAWESELGRALIRLGWARWCSLKDDGTPNERRGWELDADPVDILYRISE
jgi:hypothetical protein